MKKEIGEERPGIAQLYRYRGKQWFLRDIPGVAGIVDRYGVIYSSSYKNSNYLAKIKKWTLT